MKRVLLIIAAALLCSCNGPGRWEDTPGELVVEGWIEAGESPVVMLTTALSPSPEYTHLDSLSNHIIKRAKVSLSDGDTTVILFSKQDKRYVPPFVYTTGWITGKAGKSYTLKVEYNGKTVSARSVIPDTEPIAGVEAVPVEGSDSLYTLVVTLGNKAGANKFYRILTMVEGEDSRYISSFPSAIEGTSLKDNARITITRGKSIDHQEFSTKFKKGSTVRVKVCTCEEATCRFWMAIDDLHTLGNTPFFPMYNNPASNIEGGFGYWAGYGATVSTIVI
jgi:hypothetical protein